MITEELQKVLDASAPAFGGAGSQTYNALVSAINASPLLAMYLASAVEKKTLKAFDVSFDPDSGAKYVVRDGIETMMIGLPALLNAGGAPANDIGSLCELIFVMGHEVGHALNKAAPGPTAYETYLSDLRAISLGTSPLTYDDVVGNYLKARADDEDSAQLYGFNVLKDFVVARNESMANTPGYQSISVYDAWPARARDFISRDGQPLLDLKFNVDGLFDISPYNISGERQYYYDNPDTTVGKGRVAYSNSDIRSVLGDIFRTANGTGIVLDLKERHLDPLEISKGDLIGLNETSQWHLTDSSSGVSYVFQKDAASGNTKLSATSTYVSDGVPIIDYSVSVAGIRNSQSLTYRSPTGASVQDDKQFGSDGKLAAEQRTTVSQDGLQVTAESNPDGAGNFNSTVTKVYGDEARTELLRDLTVTRDPTSGRTTVVSSDYDPALGIAVKVNIQVYSGGGSQIVGEAQIDSGSDGQTVALLSGDVGSVDLNNATISVAAGAYVKLPGSGNKVTAADGSTIISDGDNTIAAVAGANITIDAPEGSENTIQTSNGAIKVLGDAEVSVAADGNFTKVEGLIVPPANVPQDLTIPSVTLQRAEDGSSSYIYRDAEGQPLLQIAYPDPSDPNVQTVTTYGLDGHATGSTAITQAVGGTPGEPDYGQPIANTYDVVNADADGATISTGQREVAPADGSYTDTLISAPTVANPGGTFSVISTDAKRNSTAVVDQQPITALEAAFIRPGGTGAHLPTSPIRISTTISPEGTQTIFRSSTSGKSITVKKYNNGGRAVTLDDGHGNVTIDIYNKYGAPISASWSHADGSSGQESLFDNSFGAYKSGASTTSSPFTALTKFYSAALSSSINIITVNVPVSASETLVNPDGSYQQISIGAQDRDPLNPDGSFNRRPLRRRKTSSEGSTTSMDHSRE